jgi:hypothetical protein
VVLQNESFAYVKKIVLLEDQLGIKKEETSILNKQIVKLKDDYRWSSRRRHYNRTYVLVR